MHAEICRQLGLRVNLESLFLDTSCWLVGAWMPARSAKRSIRFDNNQHALSRAVFYSELYLASIPTDCKTYIN